MHDRLSQWLGLREAPGWLVGSLMAAYGVGVSALILFVGIPAGMVAIDWLVWFVNLWFGYMTDVTEPFRAPHPWNR